MTTKEADKIFNKVVEKILDNSSLNSDGKITGLLDKYSTNSYYSAFDFLMGEPEWCGYFNIERLINYPGRLKYEAVVGYKPNDFKTMKFTRYDTALKWLAKETLYFIRDEIS